MCIILTIGTQVHRIRRYFKGVETNQNMKSFLRLLFLQPVCLFCCLTTNMASTIAYQLNYENYEVHDFIGYTFYILQGTVDSLIYGYLIYTLYSSKQQQESQIFNLNSVDVSSQIVDITQPLQLKLGPDNTAAKVELDHPILDHQESGQSLTFPSLPSLHKQQSSKKQADNTGGCNGQSSVILSF